MDELRALLEAAFDEVVGRLADLERRLDGRPSATTPPEIVTTLALLAEAIQDLRRQPALAPNLGERPDAGALEDRLEQLSRAIEGRLADGQHRVEEGLATVRQALDALHDGPGAVDLRAVEEAARRAALPNAADLANLRGDVEGLIEAVQLQDKNLSELRTTLEWIKERLLLR